VLSSLTHFIVSDEVDGPGVEERNQERNHGCIALTVPPGLHTGYRSTYSPRSAPHLYSLLRSCVVGPCSPVNHSDNICRCDQHHCNTADGHNPFPSSNNIRYHSDRHQADQLATQFVIARTLHLRNLFGTTRIVLTSLGLQTSMTITRGNVF